MLEKEIKVKSRIQNVFKNICSSTSHKKNSETGILAFFLTSNTFIYKPILIKISINAKIKKAHIFHEV